MTCQLRLVTTCLFLLVGFNAVAQKQKIVKSTDQQLIRQLDSVFVDYFTKSLAGDADKAVAHIHPDALRQIGGEAGFRASFAKRAEMMENSGSTMRLVKTVPPTRVLMADSTYQAAFTYTLSLKMGMREMPLENVMVAYSPDRGRHWYFFDVHDGSSKQVKSLRKSFPFIWKQLKVPEIKD